MLLVLPGICVTARLGKIWFLSYSPKWLSANEILVSLIVNVSLIDSYLTLIFGM